MPDPPPAASVDSDALWDFTDPTASEARFREHLTTLDFTPTIRAELLTQIARAQGLQRRFADALATLDAARSVLDPHTPRVLIRIDLKRDRVLNSSGDASAAIPHFTAAWESAQAARKDVLAIDAAHMLAIVVPPEDALP